MPLSDVVIRKAQAAEKTIRLHDEKGLYMEISPSGGKWWRFKYRFDGKDKRISLGTYPEVGLKEAREKRDKAREKVRNGIDPSAVRKAAKAAKAEEDSFETVAREWHTKHGSAWASEKYREVTLRRLELNVFPWLGKRPVADITAKELLEVLKRVEDRGAIDTAHRIHTICGQVLRYAVSTGRAKHDPSRDISGALTPRQPTHFAATTEPKRLAEILRALDGYPGTLVVQSAMKLAPLLFVRPGELRHAEWKDIDLEKGEWRFLVTKTQTQHVVPLCMQAVAILKTLQPLTNKSAYVFPCARSIKRPMSDVAVLAAMRRSDIGKDEMTGHGFRAVARTILDEELGFRPDFIEHQLAHAVKDPNGRAYNRTAHLEERRKMMQAWADYLDKLKQLKPVQPRDE
ncbi:MAG: integrase [Holophagaceae bacterium]|nr:integrase [Holophagaceae bacterium]